MASSPSGSVLVFGTQECPFRTLLVGFGPAGTSVLVRAIRLQMMDELCRLGVCVIDGDSDTRLGGGRLQDYLINSNTWAEKFFSNVMTSFPAALPPESIENSVLESLSDKTSAHYSKSGEILEAKGKGEVPLSTVAHFFRDVAARVRDELAKYPKSCIVHSNSVVTNIQRVPMDTEKESDENEKEAENEEKCTCDCADFSSDMHLSHNDTCHSCSKCLWLVTMTNKSTNESTRYYTRNVVLATGGKQLAPDLGGKDINKKVICSDDVCTLDGITQVKNKLLKGDNNVSKKRIVIVGGSHSAFSAAWMCLQKISLDEKEGEFGQSSICILHRSPIRVFYGTPGEARNDGYENIGIVNKSTGQIHPFGGLRGDAKALWRNIRDQKETRVRLIKAPGPSIQNKLFEDASVIIWACGYKTNVMPIRDVEGNCIPLRMEVGQVAVNDLSQILTDDVVPDISCEMKTGVELFSDSVKNGDPVNSGNTIAISPNSNNQSNSLPENERRLISPVRQSAKNVPETPPSKKGHDQSKGLQGIPTQGVPICGLLGLGLGYGLKATLDNSNTLDGSTGRADGIAVYLKRAATLILSVILSTKVFGEDEGGTAMRNWDQRAMTINNTKKLLLKKEQESKALDEASIEEKEDKEEKASSSPTRTSNKSKDLVSQFPSIKTDVTEENSSTRTYDLAAPRIIMPRILNNNDSHNNASLPNKGKSFVTGALSNGLLSTMETYTMSEDFRKKLRKSMDPSDLAKSVDRLSKPKPFHPISRPSTGSDGDSNGNNSRNRRRVVKVSWTNSPLSEIDNDNGGIEEKKSSELSSEEANEFQNSSTISKKIGSESEDKSPMKKAASAVNIKVIDAKTMLPPLNTNNKKKGGLPLIVPMEMV